jgi:nucleotide-binding universal stress UspA family protein
MPLSKILFPTGFETLDFHCLESLLVLRDAGLREIVLCHIIPVEEVGFVPFGGYLKEEEERLREEARIRFEDWQDAIDKAGIRSRVVIEVGRLVPRIIHIAESEGVDMVVLGKTKKTLSERFFVGSHALEVASRLGIPSLMNKYMVHYEIDGTEFTRTNDRIFDAPMLAFDWSGPSKRALEFLKWLKGVVKRVYVFHSIVPEDKEGMVKEEEVCREELSRCCDILGSAGIEAEMHVGSGEAVEEIIRFSRERGVSMIITGTSGRRPMDELIHGSVSFRVATLSELPTIMVP